MPKNVLRDTREVLTQPLYDTEVISNAFLGTKSFFVSTQGKNKTLTNLTSAQQLSRGNQFTCEGIAVKVMSEQISLTELNSIFVDSQSFLKFRLESKIKLELPLDVIPSGNSFVKTIDQTGAAAVQFSQNGFQSVNNYFKLKKKIVISALSSFQVDVEFYKALNLSTDYNLRVMLLGTLRRPAQ